MTTIISLKRSIEKTGVIFVRDWRYIYKLHIRIEQIKDQTGVVGDDQMEGLLTKKNLFICFDNDPAIFAHRCRSASITGMFGCTIRPQADEIERLI